jgi:hypothetical protein
MQIFTFSLAYTSFSADRLAVAGDGKGDWEKREYRYL